MSCSLNFPPTPPTDQEEKKPFHQDAPNRTSTMAHVQADATDLTSSIGQIPFIEPLADPDTIYYAPDLPRYLNDTDSFGGLYLVSDSLFEWSPDGKGFTWQTRSTARFLPLPTIEESSREGSPKVKPVSLEGSANQSLSGVEAGGPLEGKGMGSGTGMGAGVVDRGKMTRPRHEARRRREMGKHKMGGEMTVDTGDLPHIPTISPLDLPPSPISPTEEDLQREFHFDISFPDFKLDAPAEWLESDPKLDGSGGSTGVDEDKASGQQPSSTGAPYLPPITPYSTPLSISVPAAILENLAEGEADGKKVSGLSIVSSRASSTGVRFEAPPTPPTATAAHRQYCLSRDFGSVPKPPKHPVPCAWSCPLPHGYDLGRHNLLVSDDSNVIGPSVCSGTAFRCNPSYGVAEPYDTWTPPHCPPFSKPRWKGPFTNPSLQPSRWPKYERKRYEKHGIGSCRHVRRREKMLKGRRDANMKAWKREWRINGFGQGLCYVPGPPSSGWKIWEIIGEEEEEGGGSDQAHASCMPRQKGSRNDMCRRESDIEDGDTVHTDGQDIKIGWRKRMAVAIKGLVRPGKVRNKLDKTAKPVERARQWTKMMTLTTVWYCSSWCRKMFRCNGKEKNHKKKRRRNTNNRKNGNNQKVVEDRSAEVLGLLVSEKIEIEEEREWEGGQLERGREREGGKYFDSSYRKGKNMSDQSFFSLDGVNVGEAR